MTYLIAALQTVGPGIREGVLTVLQSPQPPPPESTLTALLNDVTDDLRRGPDPFASSAVPQVAVGSIRKTGWSAGSGNICMESRQLQVIVLA